MAMTDTSKETGLIRNLRDRWRRSRLVRRQGEQESTDIVRRGDYPLGMWDPLRVMAELLRDPMRAMGWLQSSERELWFPQFEVRENGNAIRILGDLPGIKPDDVEISLTGNRLMVSGQRSAEQRNKDESVHAYERRFGQFVRSFTLPDSVDLEHVTSELRDGVLTIVAPLKTGASSRRIQVGRAQPRS